jgi:fatty acid amide hydrolase
MGLVSMESNNRVFGATKNPFDETRSCGGSTGGEGGLIAARCSPIGIGTDLAGSLRLPAGYCGIYSFMPTMARHNLYGMILTDLSKVLYRGTQKELNSAIGPMGRSVDDLILVLQQYLGHVERNPLKSPMKWDQTVFENTKKTRNLKIAYILDDEFCETAPGVRKIVKDVVEKLKAQGHTVQEFPKLRNLGDFLKVGLQLMFAPGVTKGINIGRKEEYVAEPQKVPQFLDSLPEFLKRILEKILKAIGEVRGHFLFDAFYKMSVTDVLKCSSDKEMLKEKFYNTWIENKYDVIINPVLPCVAVPNGLAGEVGVIIQHTILYNLLEFCAGCVPIRALKEDEQGYETRYKDRIAKGLEKVMKNSKGLPVAIQVAAPAYQDEKALAVMKIIEEAFNYHPYDSLKL